MPTREAIKRVAPENMEFCLTSYPIDENSAFAERINAMTLADYVYEAQNPDLQRSTLTECFTKTTDKLPIPTMDFLPQNPETMESDIYWSYEFGSGSQSDDEKSTMEDVD